MLEFHTTKLAQKACHPLPVISWRRAQHEFAGFTDLPYFTEAAGQLRQVFFRRDAANAASVLIQHALSGTQDELPVPQQGCVVEAMQWQRRGLVRGKAAHLCQFIATYIVNGCRREAGPQQ